ncbi:hypothetical protein Ptr902_01248 [Pyrenophora tritici-repentis]|nr:hypothetical protein Ptr902_01248 [Pyrenophora tritici-repentis]
MVIQWNNAQITERLFIAMLASVDNKVRTQPTSPVPPPD